MALSVDADPLSLTAQDVNRELEVLLQPNPTYGIVHIESPVIPIMF
jgi:hypothetical protein